MFDKINLFTIKAKELIFKNIPEYTYIQKLTKYGECIERKRNKQRFEYGDGGNHAHFCDKNCRFLCKSRQRIKENEERNRISKS